MKKILVFVLVGISLFTLSANGITRKQYLEDINSLEDALKNYCISYEAIQKSKKFDIDKHLSDLKRKKMTSISPYELFDVLCDAFKNIPDHHMSFSYHGENSLLWEKEFKKLGESGNCIISKDAQLYFSLPDFQSKETFENIKRFELMDLSDFDKIILDLRGNTGGDFEIPAKMLYKRCGQGYKDSARMGVCEKIILFKESPYYSFLRDKLSENEIRAIQKGKVITKTFNASNNFLNLEKTPKAFSGEIIIIVDGCTASSAECLILFLKHKFLNLSIIGIETAAAYSYGGAINAVLENSGISIGVTQFQTRLAYLQDDFLDPETGIVPDFVTEDIKELEGVLHIKNVLENIVELVVVNYRI